MEQHDYDTSDRVVFLLLFAGIAYVVSLLALGLSADRTDQSNVAQSSIGTVCDVCNEQALVHERDQVDHDDTRNRHPQQ
jgi:hypothetical protein